MQEATRPAFVKGKIVLQSNKHLYELPTLTLLPPANMYDHFPLQETWAKAGLLFFRCNLQIHDLNLLILIIGDPQITF